jgi:hypothetical protein
MNTRTHREGDAWVLWLGALFVTMAVTLVALTVWATLRWLS